MQRLKVSGAVRPIYGSLGVKRLIHSRISVLGGTPWCSWSRYCATSRMVVGSIYDVVTGIFH